MGFLHADLSKLLEFVLVVVQELARKMVTVVQLKLKELVLGQVTAQMMQRVSAVFWQLHPYSKRVAFHFSHK